MIKRHTSKRGRPRLVESKTSQVTTVFPDAMLEAIEALRAGRIDAPSRSVLIRELVVEALAARAKKGGK